MRTVELLNGNVGMTQSVDMNNGNMGNQGFVFLTMNDFSKDGGGTLRMYGILNALAENDCHVTLISNASETARFHPAIRHIDMGRTVSARQKALLQGMMAWLPCTMVAFVFRKLLRRLKESLDRCPYKTDSLYSFEYLDNSLACLVNHLGYVSRYVNDTHGMAVPEFDAQLKSAATLFQKTKFYIKRQSAERLDRKVFSGAAGIIFGSSEMQHYYDPYFSGLDQKPGSIVIPYVFGGDSGNQPDPELEKRLRENHDISRDDFLFLFAGSYKATSGVDNLIDAFCEVHSASSHTKLMLIGRTGPLWQKCREKASHSRFGKAIIFIDSIPYNELVTYQQLANVVVCPDRANDFSEYIIHTKYFDSLWSGKPVISGRFAVMKEINPDDALSLSFAPGDPEDLRRVMQYSVDNYGELAARYERNREYVSEHFTYRSFAGKLTDWNNKRQMNDT